MMEKDIFFDPLNAKLASETDQLITSFSRLRYTALAEEETLRIGPCRYKWEIGVEIYRKLVNKTHMVGVERLGNNKYTQYTIMGYPMQINHDEKDVIKLWREVKA